MPFMLKSTHLLILQALEKASAATELSLRFLLQARDQQLADTQDRLARALAKIERMELVLMPLSSAAGAAYQASLHPVAPQGRGLVSVPNRSESWAEYRAKYIADMESELSPAQQETLKEEKAHGVPS